MDAAPHHQLLERRRDLDAALYLLHLQSRDSDEPALMRDGPPEPPGRPLEDLEWIDVDGGQTVCPRCQAVVCVLPRLDGSVGVWERGGGLHQHPPFAGVPVGLEARERRRAGSAPRRPPARARSRRSDV